ncbi:MAG TPA: DUF4382 domain-containing protein [Candidatus Binatia bacterium]|nr:DUF4382 domain-containing protein [Candidatus Binatia bacterium]
MRKWVIGVLVVLILLAGCSKKEVAETTPVPETAPAPTPVVETPPAPTTGTAVFTVTDAAVKESSISKLTVTLTDIAVHVAGAEGDWVTVNGTQEFELTTLQNTQELLANVDLAPAKYTQIRLAISKASATISGKSYDVKVPSGTLKLIGVLDVAAGTTATATLDFDVNSSLFLAGDKAYLKPTIKLTTKKNAMVDIKNKSVTIKGGETETDESQGPDKLYTPGQLNGTKNSCLSDCGTFCGKLKTSCGADCAGKVSAGCQSEDVDYCRETCEPYVHPAICKKGCLMLSDSGNDTVADCTDYLTDSCTDGCNMTKTDCDTDCVRDC